MGLFDKNKSLVQEFTLIDGIDVTGSSGIKDEVLKLGAELGEQGKMILKLWEQPGKISVLVEADKKKLREEYMKKFETFLKKNEYIKCFAHDNEAISVTTYGDDNMDYSSTGGGTEAFTVTLLMCKKCGRLSKSYSGSLNCIDGDPRDYLIVTESDKETAYGKY